MPVLVDPTGQTTQTVKSRAPRTRHSLRGARVCMIDNGKKNADLLLQAIGALLRERYGVAEVVMHRKPNISVPVEPQVVADLKSRCDLAIAAVGD
uniref:UGSC-like domain-containing protein n=1 Tax=Thermomicrobium roseum TaxID=500 RepID=A0A7C1K4N7_THERO